MRRERRNQHQNPVPPRRTQPSLPWTPRICSAPNMKKDEMTWARIGEAGGCARPLMPRHCVLSIAP
jgi:hypothetical protein